MNTIECPICHGAGRVPCECVECGSLHMRECRTCGGSGDVRTPFVVDAPIDDPQVDDDRWTR